MNVSIVGRNLDLTDVIKNHVNNTVETFEKYNLDITSIHIVISKDEKHKKPNFTFEYVLHVANQDTIVVKQNDKDLYACIDLATDRISKILRRHADKIKSHKAQKLTSLDIVSQEQVLQDELEAQNEEIVPVKLKSYKPTEIADALEELKDSDDIFKVFYDMDENLRVLYKMKDGKHFGLF
jgi:putative sigma-54 modulation protein